MALTDASVRNAKPQSKAYTLSDIQGLTLFVSVIGSKSWHFRFKLKGKRHRISLGQYPEICLKEARDLCQKAREVVDKGFLPGERYQENEQGEPQTESFAAISERWKAHKLKKLGHKAPKEKKNKGRQSTEIQIERYLRLDILPVLGSYPIGKITRMDVLAVQKRVEARSALSIAEKIRTWLNEIFRYAVATGVINTNPASDMDIMALPYRRIKHNPFLRMHEMPELMAALHHYKGDRQTELGLRLLLLTGVRTGELRFAEPKQFDLQKGIWTIPAEDVKQLQKIKHEKDPGVPDYIVPLSKHAITIIQELKDCLYPRQRYLLCQRSNPSEAISENTLNAALSRIGFKGRLTGHGIRATLSTALNELEYNKDWIEAQLSHASADRTAIRKIYNHAEYIEQRRKMMQDWADKLTVWEKEGITKNSIHR